MSAPPNTPPILEYATPERRVPVYLVVILYLWAVVGALGGAFLCLAGLAMIGVERGYTSTSSPIWCFFRSRDWSCCVGACGALVGHSDATEPGGGIASGSEFDDFRVGFDRRDFRNTVRGHI